MPLFLPTLIFAISLSLLPGTEPAVEEEPGQTGVTSTPNGQPATPPGNRPRAIRSADSVDSANSESSALKQKLEERVVGSSAPITRRTHPRLTRSVSMPLAPRSDFPHQSPSSTSNSSVSSPTFSPRLSPSTAHLPAAPPRAITPI
ncbi:hypothetical protein DB88DRAFT_511019 [Papiliotrema laurentii]|uniref:Uncharacterized protein n=1 Tax=Papiliotrema laurentii TaxID=5418 RepID=A0AAD9CWY1_PAPLA|nr:hypothetical protein DB88DRAFT_511019 [Papiliotrema laurentii]